VLKRRKEMDKLIIIQKKLKNRQDSFWYEGAIARFGNCLLIACGDIRINNKKGELVYDNKERGSGFDFELETDEDLKKIGSNYDDKYYWENNNWFEVVKGYVNENGTFIVEDCLIGDVVYTYDEGIELLKQYYKEKIYKEE
jgi:hypothetical protein